MFGRRVRKTDIRVAAYGAVDELNAALGLARAANSDARLADALLTAQRDLIAVMGELATVEEDLQRYADGGYSVLSESSIESLEKLTHQIEADCPPIREWIIPGGTEVGARLHFARTVCRRAERAVLALYETLEEPVGENRLTRYLNRLGDALWAMALSLERG